jgi:hypothetical protein
MTPGCPILVSLFLRDRVGLFSFDPQSRLPTHKACSPLTARHNHPIHSTPAALSSAQAGISTVLPSLARYSAILPYPPTNSWGQPTRLSRVRVGADASSARVYRAAAVGRGCESSEEYPAAKRRKNTAHSAIRGIREIENQPAPGAKESPTLQRWVSSKKTDQVPVG